MKAFPVLAMCRLVSGFWPLVPELCSLGWTPAEGRHRSPTLDRIQFWSDRIIVPQEALLDPADLLRRHGLQVTAQRLAVLRAVSGRVRRK